MSQTPVPPGVVASAAVDPEVPFASMPASGFEPVLPASPPGPTLASGLPVVPPPVELDPELPPEPELPAAPDPAALDPVLDPELMPVLTLAPEFDPELPLDPAEPLALTPELAPEGEAPLDESPLAPWGTPCAGPEQAPRNGRIVPAKQIESFMGNVAPR
jgi:hypothetical protein